MAQEVRAIIDIYSQFFPIRFIKDLWAVFNNFDVNMSSLNTFSEKSK